MEKGKQYRIPEPTKIKYKKYKEPTFGFLINLIPAFIWALVITDQALPWELTFWSKFGIGFAFIVLYIVISKIPFITFAATIASAIMFIGLLWVPLNLISIVWLKFIIKAVIALLIGMAEILMSIVVTIKVFD